MKYYKNLIIKKKFGKLLGCFIVALVGFICFYFNCIDVIINNIKFSDISTYVVINNGIIGIFGITNIGLSILGIFIIYIGLVFMPRNMPESQDDSDYEIESDEYYINIKFKNNEFHVKKENFSPTDLFFRDKNKKFVSMTRGYQIYNYIMYKYKDMTEKKINKDNIISKSDVVNKFNNVKELSLEEKENYITRKNIKNKPRIFFVILSIILFLNLIFWVTAIIGAIMKPIDYTIYNWLCYIFMSVLSFYLWRKSNKAINKNKDLIKKIINGKMYLVECYVYDKKLDKTQDTNGKIRENYYIKITDNHYVVDSWIEIPKSCYRDEENYTKTIISTNSDLIDIFEIDTTNFINEKI